MGRPKPEVGPGSPTPEADKNGPTRADGPKGRTIPEPQSWLPTEGAAEPEAGVEAREAEASGMHFPLGHVALPNSDFPLPETAWGEAPRLAPEAEACMGATSGKPDEASCRVAITALPDRK